jgi:hypothetical protein
MVQLDLNPLAEAMVRRRRHPKIDDDAAVDGSQPPGWRLYVPGKMMTTVLAARRSAFWHVPMSVMPARWVSISVCGSERGRSL